jgi:hypothetical protein
LRRLGLRSFSLFLMMKKLRLRIVADLYPKFFRRMDHP